MPRLRSLFAVVLGLGFLAAAALAAPAAQIKGAFREADFNAEDSPKFTVLGKDEGYRCVLKEAVGYVVRNGTPDIDYGKSAFLVFFEYTENPRPAGKKDVPWIPVFYDQSRPDREWKLEPVTGRKEATRRGDEKTLFRAVLKRDEKKNKGEKDKDDKDPDTVADRTPGPGRPPQKVAVAFRLRFKGDDFTYHIGEKVVGLK